MQLIRIQNKSNYVSFCCTVAIYLFCGPLAQVHEKEVDRIRDENKSNLPIAPKDHISDSHNAEKLDSARRALSKLLQGNCLHRASILLGVLIISVSR